MERLRNKRNRKGRIKRTSSKEYEIEESENEGGKKERRIRKGRVGEKRM